MFADYSPDETSEYLRLMHDIYISFRISFDMLKMDI